MYILAPFEQRIRAQIRDELARKPAITITALKEQLEKQFSRGFHYKYIRRLTGRFATRSSFRSTAHRSSFAWHHYVRSIASCATSCSRSSTGRKPRPLFVNAVVLVALGLTYRASRVAKEKRVTNRINDTLLALAIL